MPKVKAMQFLVFVLLGFFAMPGLSGSAFAAPPLSVYGKLPGFEMAAISPSGDHVALIGTVGEERRLIVLDKELKLVKTALVGEAKIRRLQWVGDMAVLLERSDTAALGIGFTANKAELHQAIVFPIGKGESWAVFAKNTSIAGGVRSFYGINQRDGKWFAYYGGITLESASINKSDLMLISTDPVLYEVDLQTRRERKIASRIGTQQDYRDWLVGSDGKVSATLDIHAGSGTWEIRNRQNREIAGGKNALGRVSLLSFGATPDSIIYFEEDAGGERRWFEAPLAGGAAQEILKDVAIRWRIDDKRANRLIGYALDGDTPSYKFFDPHRQKVVAATQKAFPGVSMNLIDWNDRFDRLIVMTEGTGDPQTWWLVDIKTGKAEPLGTSYPMADKDVAPMKMIRYKAGDGTDIAAVLTLPPGLPAKNLPIVVFPHGGPGARDYPEFYWWAQAFAARGYAVLQPNFRGSTGYGVAFEKAGHGEWGRKMQTDVSDGLAQLVRDGIADPKRACIMGSSYGGYAALAGVTLQQGLYRCAVSVAGVSDVARVARTDLATSGRNPMLRRALKEELGSGRDLAAVSPIRFAANANAPVLLIHGKDDTVVLYDQSNDMAKALRAAGKPVEFVTLAGEDHWLSRSETRLAMLEAAVAFVEKHNPPGPVQ